ncbi:DUF4231 domain-containing protein [Nocardia sp. NBC_01327]|uniref:DUF4231 domain-containing protein n=1 Tax=Nocardia sp. NBC_01327 TaxID=2903593 RepID=UPI002E0E451D|nr:DUF4231 domain-containing protein [Nocardia sp. NBC_01327]
MSGPEGGRRSGNEEGARRSFAKPEQREARMLEMQLEKRQLINRAYQVLTTSAALLSIVAVVIFTIDLKNVHARQGGVLCIIFAVAICGALLAIKWRERRGLLPTRVELEANLEEIRDQIQWDEASKSLDRGLSQRLYMADVPSFIRHFQKDSEKYRKRHNRLQSLVITGSLITTTVAALGDAIPQNRWLTIFFSLTVGVATGFMGYFKFRERSFYLQQSADLIEFELNSMTLRIGDYRDKEREEQALPYFVSRVEAIRDEQRRRQQQLDQPAEASVSGPAGSEQLGLGSSA